MDPKFSGHETFPLRYGWLYKSAKYLIENKKLSASSPDDAQRAIVELGVGKNMVSAIRYWAESCGVIEISRNSDQRVSDIGQYLLVKEGDLLNPSCSAQDPYLERIGSVWLVHFLLNFNEDELTSYRYFFNFSAMQNFEKEKLHLDISNDVNSLCGKEVKSATLKKDVDCFLHAYSTKSSTSVKAKAKAKAINEDHFTSPLSELGLVKDLGKGFYSSLLDERNSLPTEIFVYALLRFLTQSKMSDTSGFDSILSDQSSPGKIFRLSEKGLGIHLDNAVKMFPEIFAITDTQGMRQIRLLQQFDEQENFHHILDKYYGTNK